MLSTRKQEETKVDIPKTHIFREEYNGKEIQIR